MALLARQFFQLSAISLVSYPLGFLVQLLMSYHFGTSAQVDAYWITITIVNLLCIYANPLREALVSGYHLRLKNDGGDADRFFSAAVNLLLVLLSVSSLVLLLFPGVFARWIIEPGKRMLLEEVVRLLPMAVPLVSLVALTEIFNGLLVSRGRIFFQDLGKIAGGGVTVVSLALLAGRLGVPALIAATVATNVVILAAQVIALRRANVGYRFFTPPSLDRTTLRMSGALLVSFLVSQLYLVYERRVFVGFREGAVASFQYALALNNVFHAVCIGAMCNVIWPRIFDCLAAGNEEAIRRLMVTSARNILLLIIFLGTFSWCYADAVIFLLFFRGEFNLVSLQLTAGFFRAALFSLPCLAISGIVGRLFVSRQQTFCLFAVGIFSALGGVLTLYGARVAGDMTIAGFHTAVSALFGCATAVYMGYRRYWSHVQEKISGEIFAWGGRVGLLLLSCLILFSQLPVAAGLGKVSTVLALWIRFTGGAALFFGGALMLGLLKVGKATKVTTDGN